MSIKLEKVEDMCGGPAYHTEYYDFDRYEISLEMKKTNRKTLENIMNALNDYNLHNDEGIWYKEHKNGVNLSTNFGHPSEPYNSTLVSLYEHLQALKTQKR